jgi:hypothetical protein
MNSRTYSTRLASITLALLLSIGLSACGDDDGGSTSATAAAQATIDTTAPDNASGPAPAAGTPPSTAPLPVASTKAATLQWAAPAAKTDGSSLHDLAGYIIVYGTSANDLSQRVRVDNPSIDQYVVEQLTAGTYYFGIKAYDAAGAESEVSNLMTKVIS